MQKASKEYILVTGAAGFIGSNIVTKLNKKGYTNLILVDHMTSAKKKNIKDATYEKYYEKGDFLDLVVDGRLPKISVIIHMGACSDTREYNKEYLRENNLEYTKKLFTYAKKNNCQFIYASSASVYGDGTRGYSEKSKNLIPLNPYGHYKYLFDKWVLKQKEAPMQWVGLRFFNVYGPKESHKGHMASVVYHGFNQIQAKGVMKLFKSYKKEFIDGQQKRDFIYVGDIVDVISFFLENPKKSGIFNVGTGKARTFLDLAKAIYKILEKQPTISFIDMPEILRKKYQYNTEADIASLRKIGYKKNFTSLENGIKKYIQEYFLTSSRI